MSEQSVQSEQKYFTLIATCPEELSAVVAKQLEPYAQELVQGYKKVSCSVSEDNFYRVHLNVSAASQFFMHIKTIPCNTLGILFSKARTIHWDDFFDHRHPFRIDVIVRGEIEYSQNQASKQLREAIMDYFTFNKKPLPKVDIKEPKALLTLYIHNKKAEVSIRTSGKSLHKRGYRLAGHPAPIKETLAAALVDLMGYTGQTNFYDPFCGSGTIAIEAAMKALGKSCQIHRGKGDFDFEHLNFFSKVLWRDILDEQRQKKLHDLPCKIYASDISEDFVDLSQKNSLRARTERYMEFFVKDFFESEKPAEEGILIANIPYGERLSEDQGMEYYVKLGDHLKHHYKGWTIGLLVPEKSPYKHLGLKISKRIPILNGMIETRFLILNVY